jgi:AcrR family transcriptional regulator
MARARDAASEPPARRRIVEAARRMFYERGIRAVGVEAVVSEAGVTKMSLYRHFASKDDLVAACLDERIATFWAWFDGKLAAEPDGHRAKILALFEGLAKRTTAPGFRGCPMTNAAIEFPEPDHPGRKLAETHKRELRQRLLRLAAEAGAAEPEVLADGLVLLFEGAYASSQTFGPGGPARSAARAAAALLNAHGC